MRKTLSLLIVTILTKEKTDEFHLNFHNLHEVLKSHGLNISIKVLRLASDDSFDHMAYIAQADYLMFKV